MGGRHCDSPLPDDGGRATPVRDKYKSRFHSLPSEFIQTLREVHDYDRMSLQLLLRRRETAHNDDNLIPVLGVPFPHLPPYAFAPVAYNTRSRRTMAPNIAMLLSLLMSFMVVLIGADCECGYTASIGSNTTQPSPFLFTDLIESDFLHIKNISLDTDWRRQSFSVTPQAGRGPYGMNFTVSNVLSNYVPDMNNWTGPGVLGGDPGVQFTVDGGTPANGYVRVAEMDSARTDLLWGTYRASMKLTIVSGTCSAFFWYFNDSQEIDMEFLSSQFNPQNNTFPVNLVLQSVQSVQAGFNAVGSGNYVVANLPFNPTVGFHEYRIDFIPGNVIFYADGVQLAAMNTSAVPTQPGHLILTQWSNGNDLWSSGPPPENATITVAYVKAYFNSSLPQRQSDWAKRCKDLAATNAICSIPDENISTNPANPRTNDTSPFFFSDQANMTVNQTVYHKNNSITTSPETFQRMIILLVALSSFVTTFL